MLLELLSSFGQTKYIYIYIDRAQSLLHPSFLAFQCFNICLVQKASLATSCRLTENIRSRELKKKKKTIGGSAMGG